MSNQYILPIGYAWVDSFLDINKQIEHIVLVMHAWHSPWVSTDFTIIQYVVLFQALSHQQFLEKVFDKTAEMRTTASVMMESLQQVSYQIKLERLVKDSRWGPMIKIDLSLRSAKENLKLLSKVPRKSFWNLNPTISVLLTRYSLS